MGYLTKKFLYCLLAFFIIVTLTFFLMKVIPGDPLLQEKALPKEIHQALRAYYGLDQPLLTQYVRYLKETFTFNFGPSFIFQGVTVNQVIKESFPISALLGLEALLIAIIGGLAIGIFAASCKDPWKDRLAMSAAIIGISIPSFIVATLLQYIFAIKLGIFPIARWGSFTHTILPALSLASVPMAFIARLTRTQMREVLNQEYIKTARSKGLSQPIVILKHALRNSIIPTVNYLATLSANILTGSFVIEKIFGIPGLGHWFVTSVLNRDYSFIMGITIFYSLILLTLVFAVDLLLQVIDPRLKFQESQKHACTA